MQFNLLEDGFIPVLRMNGRFERVGIHVALTEAGGIRQITASNPMDNVALLRFLLAVLMWCRPDLSEQDRKSLEGAQGVPADWLEELNKNKAAFNLLSDGARFYQDKSVENNARPIGDLLFEFPTETKIAHLRHVRDKKYGLCPACCALGIIRFSTFANAYGGGRYTSAVNGPMPAYAIPHGPTLLETVLLNWWPDGALKRKPPWLCDDAPKQSELDTVTVFAWRSRQLWLGNPGDEGDCAYCGLRARLIRQLAFTGNWKPPFETKGNQKKFWDQDPHLILVDKAAGDEDGEEAESEATGEQAPSKQRTGKKAQVKTTLGFPAPGAKNAAHVRFWRRALAVLAARHAKAADGSGRARSILVAGPAANKGLYQDAAAVRLPHPPTDGPGATLDWIAKAVEDLPSVLKRSTPNPQRQHPNRTAALDALSPALEDDLRRALEESRRVTESVPATDESGPATDMDRLRELFGRVVEKVVRATTPGSDLRRREAMQRAESTVSEALRKTASGLKQEPSADHVGQARRGDSPKPKRRRVNSKEGTE